jgi:ABC-type dipeptide/oligopeptide/nickel transport system permease component
MYLALSTVAFAMLVAMPMGIVSAIRPNSAIDRITMLLSFTGVSTPTFWLALMLILILAVRLGWFHTSGYGGLKYLALPMLSLSAYSIGRMAQMVRTSMLDEVGKPYITTARSKGLGEWAVLLRHALRNAAIPIITLAGHELANLANGAVVVEVIFGWPGIGQLAITAIERRDFPVIQADVLVVATAVVVINLVVDVMYAWLDPRIRYE